MWPRRMKMASRLTLNCVRCVWLAPTPAPGTLQQLPVIWAKATASIKAVANFAMTYADQTERDYQLLVEAVDSGQIVVAKGI